MFAVAREKVFEGIRWNEFPDALSLRDYLASLECWQREASGNADRGVSHRRCILADQLRPRGVPRGKLEENLQQWLRQEGPYALPISSSPSPSSTGDRVSSRIRILFCDRASSKQAMTISRDAFETIEASFDLHPATLVAFAQLGGSMASFIEEDGGSGRIRLVVKACQKRQLGNFMLSLTYDIPTRSTDAFICGDGAAIARNFDTFFGSQQDQITELVLASSNIWANPLLIPTIMLQNYIYRFEMYSRTTSLDMLALEHQLGVTKYKISKGSMSNSDPGRMQKLFDYMMLHNNYEGKLPSDFVHLGINLPDRVAMRENFRNIDTMVATIKIHSLIADASFVDGCCKWMQNYAAFLARLVDTLQGKECFQDKCFHFTEVRQNLEFHASATQGIEFRFNSYKARANQQSDVLFNIMSQQANILNRLDSRLNIQIAKDTKQEGLSISAFTFITALFLPGNFVATLFGMSMFNWQGPSAANGTADNSYVVPSFWIFWAVVIPLTIVTMASWYAWYRYATRKWRDHLASREHKEETEKQSELFSLL